jgi:hypothetical protein
LSPYRFKERDFRKMLFTANGKIFAKMQKSIGAGFKNPVGTLTFAARQVLHDQLLLNPPGPEGSKGRRL